jgi:hypothetical protein
MMCVEGEWLMEMESDFATLIDSGNFANHIPIAGQSAGLAGDSLC